MKAYKCNRFFNLSFLFLAGIFLNGCTQTEVEQGLTEKERGKEITLSLSSPSEAATRADANHKLRYIAKLFKGGYNDVNGVKFLERKEAIATDGKSTIVFSVPEGDYSVLIFADYIPSSTNANSQGFYEDKYYDTSSETETIRMRAFTTGQSDELLHFHCINNDNYDAFSGYTGIISKGPQKEERNITLTRCVSKVRFISSTNPTSTVNQIKFSKFSYCDVYMQYAGTALIEREYDHMKLSNYSLSGMSNSSNNELFYFYTFASKSESTLKEFSFIVSFNGTNNTYPVELGFDKVFCRQNYITTVNGAFLASESTDEGDLILNLSKDDEWNN